MPPARRVTAATMASWPTGEQYYGGPCKHPKDAEIRRNTAKDGETRRNTAKYGEIQRNTAKYSEIPRKP